MAYLPSAEPKSDPDAPRRFSSSELMAMTGATYRQVDFWCRAGYLQETAHGSGSARTFTPDEVATVHAVVQLLWAGLTLPAAFIAAADLVEHGRYDVRFGKRYRMTITRVAEDDTR